MNLLSIVILNFNGRHFLEKFLPSVISYSEGHLIVVADNRSTDDSLDFLQKNFPEVKTLSFATNEGYAGGYNLALQQIQSKYYLVLNSDVEVTPGWLNPMINFMESHGDYAACQPKLRSYDNRRHFEYSGAAGGYLDWLGYPFCRGRIFNTIEEDHGQYDNNADIFWASGACMLLRAEAFHSVGGFDASFFAHMEEIDLFWRLKKLGWKIYYLSESTVYHVGGGTLSKTNPRKTFLNFRNNLAMLIKNLSTFEFFVIMPVRFFLDMTAALKFLFFDSFRDSLAVIKAYLSVTRRFRTYRRSLKSMPPPRYRNNDLTGRFKRSVLLDYYLKGKKRFSQLDI